MSDETPIPNGTPVPLTRGDRVVVVRGKHKRTMGTVDDAVFQADEGVQVVAVALDGGDTVVFGRRSLVKYDSLDVGTSGGGPPYVSGDTEPTLPGTNTGRVGSRPGEDGADG